MNQTSEQGTRETPGEPYDSHHYREQLHQFDRLRRSSTDRYVAGVCGGLGRHFGIDPTLIRILLAVMCLFGGAGLLFYVAVWLFVPEDGRTRASLHVDTDTRRVVVLVAGAIALVCVAGSAWGGFGWGGGWGAGWTIGIVAVVLAVVLGSRRRSEAQPGQSEAQPGQSEAQPGRSEAQPGRSEAQPGQSAGAPGPGTGPASGSDSAARPEGDSAARPESDSAARAHTALIPRPPAPPAVGQGPPDPSRDPAGCTPPPPPPPRRPRRTGPVLFWPTLALIAIGMGVLGIYDIDHHVAAAAWPALALAITGLMLLVGAFVGRPGGLILVGCLLVAALSVTSIADSVTWEKDRVFTPATTAGVLDSYAIGNGRMVVDLSEVRDPARLDGRTIEAHLDAGEVEVILPPGVAADVDADISLAGSIDAGAGNEDGVSPSLQRRVGPADAPTLIELRTWAQLGHVEVRTATAEEAAR